MKCLECGAATEVLDTRISVGGVIRRRKCFNMHIFKTVEVRRNENYKPARSAANDHECFGEATVQQGESPSLLYGTTQ